MVTTDDILWMAETVYIFLPAYIANATPVIFGGGKPLDGGRTWRDDRPLFGNHKTVRGTIVGIAAGTAVGLVQFEPLHGLLLAVGAISGDIAVSFVKRRLKLRPGAPFPIADQLGFIIVALALASVMPSPPTWKRAIAILLATIPIHIITNFFAWLLKLKKEPW